MVPAMGQLCEHPTATYDELPFMLNAPQNRAEQDLESIVTYQEKHRDVEASAGAVAVSPPSKVARVPRAYLDTVLLMPPQRPLSVETGTTRLCSTSTAAWQCT